MVILLRPIIGMIHNTGAGRWHPIVYSESPLPGPPAADKPVRHKSIGHHTTGFATRDEALQHVDDELAAQVTKAACGVEPQRALHPEDDVVWDGNDIPGTVAFFMQAGGETRRAL